jgi:CxxC-x17-CxxC domain-containing protein
MQFVTRNAGWNISQGTCTQALGTVSSLSRTVGEGAMEFVDRILKCSDCSSDFVFTAGEQIFFYDKQFKNDPKRCKLCKAKRAGMGRSTAAGVATLPLSRTETKTECSACGVETTVPFKPTQGRPVLCRSCFQLKRVPSAVAAVANLDSPEAQVAVQVEALQTQMAETALAAAAEGTTAATPAMEAIQEAPPAVTTESAEATVSEAVALSLDAPQA